MSDEAIAQGAQIIDKWAEKLSVAVSQYGPDATNLAIEVGRIGALNCVVGGFAALLLATGLAALCWWLWLKVARAQDEAQLGLGLLASVVSLGCFACVFGALMQLSNVYAWAGIWHPEIYLAAKALNL